MLISTNGLRGVLVGVPPNSVLQASIEGMTLLGEEGQSHQQLHFQAHLGLMAP